MKLTDICDFQGGSQPPKNQWSSEPKEGYIRMLQIRDFTQDNSKVEYVKITNSIKKCNGKDILIARYGASIGKILTGLSGAYNVAMMKVVIDENIVDRNFIYNFLKSDMFQNYIKNVGQRAAQAGFNKEELSKININLPTLEEQKNIAQELNKVQEIIDIRKKQIDQLYELIKSQFVEMFGDPVLNEKQWKKTHLGDECNIITGNTPSRNKKEYYGDFIEWIKSDNINTPSNYITQAEEYLSEEGEKVGRTINANSILMTCIAGSISCIGNVAMTDRKVAFNQQINGIETLKNNVNFMYIQFLLSKEYIQSTINMSLKGILSKGKLSELEFIFPPIELQNQFADIVKQFDKQKFKVQESLNKMQNLYEALMNQYFG